MRAQLSLRPHDVGSVQTNLKGTIFLLAVERLVGLGHFGKDTCVLLGGDSLDDQQGGDHQNDGDDHADHSALDDTGNDEADEGNGSHGDTVGDLGGHVVQVEAVGAGRSHDGGIGDGGQVVAAHAAGAGSSQTHGQQSHLGIPVKHGADQRDHDADGTPRGTGGEADEAGHDEDHGGQELSKAAGVGHNALYEGTHLQTIVTAQAAQGPGEAEDQDGGDHLDEAVGNGFHGLVEANQATAPVVHEGEHNGDDGAQAQAGTGLCLGSIIAIVFTFVYYWCRGLIGFNKSMEAIPNGFIQMISPILILCFAWTLCGLCRDNGLQVGAFVEGVMANTGSLAKFLPAVIFIVACFIGFATGTSWGTIGIMVPLVCAVFDWDTQMTLLSVGLAASCAGGVCGDHLSPISDTTIMASAGAHCFHLNHVATQIPYGITVAAVSFVSFIIAGIVQSAVVCMIIAIVLMIATLLVIKAITAKKHAGIFAEMAEADKALYSK